MVNQVEMFRLSNTIDSVIFTFPEIHPFISADIVNDLTKKLVFYREKSCDYYLKYGAKNVKMEMIPNVPLKYINNFLDNP